MVAPTPMPAAAPLERPVASDPSWGTGEAELPVGSVGDAGALFGLPLVPVLVERVVPEVDDCVSVGAGTGV